EDGRDGKAGTTIYVRRPARYAVRTNATYTANDHVETSTALTVSSQYGIDVSFTSKELTMDLNQFSDVVLKPAMAQLAAKIEGDALSVAYKSIANYVGTTSTQLTFLQFAQGGQALTEALAPVGNRTAFLTPASKVQFMDATKGLFHDSENIQDQYKEGLMGRTSGFTVYENTFIPTHTTGSLAGTPLTTGTSWSTSTTAATYVATTGVPIDGATSLTTLKAGDIVTFGTVASGIVDIHPETKVSLGRLKKFVVQSDVTFTTAASAYTATVSPGVITGSGNPYQNCVNTKADTDNMTVTMFGVASTAYGQNIQMHKDAFAFATVDLVDVSKYGAWGARDSMDGISMRLARQWAAATDTVATRFDVYWGFAPLYPDLAVRSFYAP
ncbi:MAG: hypothetical protein RI908_1329, partial [Actinomycetota bacterium]